MRWIASVLVLINVVVFLFAQRLPETRSPEPPPPNLPRVSLIELLDEPEPGTVAGGHQGDGRCLALSGFVRPGGARDWARVRGLPSHSYRIEPAGTQQRPVFRVVSKTAGSRESMLPLLRAALELGMDAYLVEDADSIRVQAGISQRLPEAQQFQRQAVGLSEEFALERDRQYLYSFALVAEDKRLTQLLGQEQTGTSSWLSVVQCETVAKPRQNP